MTASPSPSSRTPIRYLLNAGAVSSASASGRLLLDHLRRDLRLVGTKEGCREGDCGACSVLVGEPTEDGTLRYRAVPACMLLVGHVRGRHVVTIEGLNLPTGLTPQQTAMVEFGGSQCGFCTPGFIVSFTGFLLNATEFTEDEAVRAIGGNLCRCTGYVSIVRAARALVREFGTLMPPGAARVEALVAAGALPEHFGSAAARLRELGDEVIEDKGALAALRIGGGTDLIVQRGAELDELEPLFLMPPERERLPSLEGDELRIPAAATFEDLRRSSAFARVWPTAAKDLELFASSLIRERATVAGNLANASPIADGTAMLLALEAILELEGGATARRLPLASFFLGYKQLALEDGERIVSVRIPVRPSRRVHFEKISKRTFLDIATVNSGLGIDLRAGVIEHVTISAGGVAPTPLVLAKTTRFLTGRKLDDDTLLRAAELLDTELAPISDVRGSAAYKRLALRQLFFAHFLELFPDHVSEAALLGAVR